MASAFGGGSSQSAFGARGGATVLSKATAILAVLFMLGALVLAIIGQRRPGIGRQRHAGPPPAPKARHRAGDAGDNAGAGDGAPRRRRRPARRQQPATSVRSDASAT